MTWFLFCYWYEPDAPRIQLDWFVCGNWRDTAARGIGSRCFLHAIDPRCSSESSVAPIPLVPWPFASDIICGSFFPCQLRACRSKPDVVYYRWMDSPHPLLLARLFGAQCICEVNGEPVPPWCTSGLRSWMAHALAAFALRRCDRVVVLTNGLRCLVAIDSTVCRPIAWSCYRAGRIQRCLDQGK